MPRTKYSIPEPIPYEDQLDMIDKKDLIAHALKLEQHLVRFEEGMAKLETDMTAQIATQAELIVTLQKKANEPAEAVDITKHPGYRDIKKLYEEEQRRAAALDRDNRHLRSQLAHGDTGATALDVEDMKNIEAFMKILDDPGTTYYPKAVSRAFTTAVRRALNLTEDPSEEQQES